jgi:hypothetical protein
MCPTNPDTGLVGNPDTGLVNPDTGLVNPDTGLVGHFQRGPQKMLFHGY